MCILFVLITYVHHNAWFKKISKKYFNITFFNAKCVKSDLVRTHNYFVMKHR